MDMVLLQGIGSIETRKKKQNICKKITSISLKSLFINKPNIDDPLIYFIIQVPISSKMYFTTSHKSVEYHSTLYKCIELWKERKLVCCKDIHFDLVGFYCFFFGNKEWMKENESTAMIQKYIQTHILCKMYFSMRIYQVKEFKQFTKDSIESRRECRSKKRYRKIRKTRSECTYTTHLNNTCSCNVNFTSLHHQPLLFSVSHPPTPILGNTILGSFSCFLIESYSKWV